MTLGLSSIRALAAAADVMPSRRACDNRLQVVPLRLTSFGPFQLLQPTRKQAWRNALLSEVVEAGFNAVLREPGPCGADLVAIGDAVAFGRHYWVFSSITTLKSLKLPVFANGSGCRVRLSDAVPSARGGAPSD